MFEVKNAFKNIVRNKGKYIIVAILIFLITFISSIAIIINQSTNVVIEEYYQKYGATATIEFNPENLQEGLQNGGIESSELTLEEYAKYAESEYVESVSYTQTETVTSDDIETTGFAGGAGPGADGMRGNDGVEDDGDSERSGMDFLLLTGMNDIADGEEFSSDTYKLVEGEYPEEDKEILLETTTANDNDLGIGDTVEVAADTEEIELKIVGLFTATSTDTNPFVGRTIYTTYDTVSDLGSTDTRISAIYQLKSYQDVDAFEEDLYSMGLSEYMYVNNNTQVLEKLTGPLQSLKNLSNLFLVLVIILGGGILLFVNMLILKERKYEIGVLRALGKSKFKILVMLLLELVIIAVFVILVTLIISYQAAQPITDAFLNIINNTSNNMQNMDGPGGPGGGMGSTMLTTQEEQSVAVKSVFDIWTFLGVMGAWLLIIVITVSMFAFIINKQQPNEILRNRG